LNNILTLALDQISTILEGYSVLNSTVFWLTQYTKSVSFISAIVHWTY